MNDTLPLNLSETLFIRITAIVKARSGVSDMDGEALFGSVFRSEAPKLKFTPCSSQDERNEQEGFRFLFQGATKAIRNPGICQRV